MNVGSISVCLMPKEECVINDVGRLPFAHRLLRQFGTWGNWMWLTEFSIISFRDLYNMHVYDEAWKLV